MLAGAYRGIDKVDGCVYTNQSVMRVTEGGQGIYHHVDAGRIGAIGEWVGIRIGDGMRTYTRHRGSECSWLWGGNSGP